MKHIALTFLVLSFCCIAGQGAVYAENKPAFFEALYDVPVMPGLEEVPEQAMLFDKPGGRIASVTAASKTLKADEITGFYAETLPQLGWKKIDQNQYIRDDMRLNLEVSKKPPLTIIHFSLAPASPKQPQR